MAFSIALFSVMTFFFLLQVLPNLEQMQEILGHERLNVKYEDEVFDTVFEWIQEDNETRHPLMAEMLSQVQLELITNRQGTVDSILRWDAELQNDSSVVLVKTLADPYVMHCPRSAEMMQSAVDYHNLSKDKKTEYWKTREKPKRKGHVCCSFVSWFYYWQVSSQLFVTAALSRQWYGKYEWPYFISRWPKLLAVLSYAEKIIEYFDFQKENWSVLTEKPDWVFGAELGEH